MITNPLLETKLHAPRTHGRLVSRDRLREQVGRATAATLTLVSAPAGFGKTTVMAELAERTEGTLVAWLSLDAGDSDPVTFWTYVVEALDRAAPGVGSTARAILEGGQGTVEAAVTALLNGLVSTPADVVLVLDDLHAVESPAIHEQLAYVLERLPARAHLVVGTRADPPLPLARLRARGALVEIRAGDLRFSTSEAADYLRGMGLTLGDDDVAALEGRTEGWIAAMQLAALSLQGRADASEFIAAFAGDDRYIVDYLVEEVLRRQSPATRAFLLETSILSRFSAPLADAVTGRDDSRAMIEALDRGNLFLVALDDQRRWYRYHHLFGGVLQSHLLAELPAEVAALHGRASEWHEAHGDRGEAIHHALRAGDPDRAATLVELAIPPLRKLRRERTLRAWLDRIPREVIAIRPVLATAYAGAILSDNEADGVDELLTAAERQRAPVVVDREAFESMPTMIELYRAALAKMRGDIEGNIAHAQRVLELVDPSDELGRGGAAAFLGLAYWGMGDLEAGDRWYAEGMASLERGGYIADVVGGSIVRADLRLAQGRLAEARRIYEEGLALATRSQPPLRGATDMHVGLADLAYRRGDFAAARSHLDAARRLGDELAFPRNPCRTRLVDARLLQAAGDLDQAIERLDEAERLYVSEFAPDVAPIPAIRARVLIAHGRLAEARAWARTSGLSTSDDVSYVREFEHATLARLLVAEGAELPAAVGLLDRLLDSAERGRRDGSRLDILVVRALALDAAGDREGAFRALDAAVALAEPEGYVRIFLDEGAAMTNLLRAAARRSGAPSSLAELVARAVGQDGERGGTARQRLVEPLSDRELEVLRLLRSELDGPDIARELVVSLNTFRTHTKNIYAKLGVTSRRAAVRRADELDLR